MKKEYIIGLLIGCLLTASIFMFMDMNMGAKSNESRNWEVVMRSLKMIQ